MSNQFQEIKFPDSDISYIAPSFDELDRLLFDLSKRLTKKYDRLIVLAKGAWTFARTLADYLSIDQVSSLQVASYGGTVKKGKPEIVQSLPKEIDVKDKRLLVFDEVDETGDTLIVTKACLKGLGAREIDCVTLFHKPHSKVMPEYFAAETSSWVIFPHEKREFIEEISKKWQEAGLSMDEIRERFAKLGLPKEQVAYFLS